MFRWLNLLFLLLPSAILAQKLLKGVVIDEQKTPIPKASIFLNNTSIGTTANEQGAFSLYIPQGKYDLIVSSVGFITFSQPVNAAEAADLITIRLMVKAPEMETVVIEPFEKNGWERWGRWFTDNFLGTSAYGLDTKLKNPEALRFRNSKKENKLTVIALAPLVIENKALGYRITYQLENFFYDFSNRTLFYAGYPFFENLPGNKRKLKQWEKTRADVYRGSMMQFMRALYRNKIGEEGFEVRRLKKIPNKEKQRVRMIYKSNARANDNSRPPTDVNRDSTAYYNHILSQDDYNSIVGASLLPGDSIAYAIDSTMAGLDFDDYLLVTCKQKTAPAEYRQLFPKSGDVMMSELVLINGKPVEVQANGSYFNPQDLLSNGYWGWWEKMGTMLPFDYRLPKNN